MFALLVAPTSAGAVERQHHIGADLSGTIFKVKDKSSADIGGGLGIHYVYGLTDAFNLMVEGSSSLVANNKRSTTLPATRPNMVETAGVGVGYVFDVLRWVPYAGVLGHAYALHGGTLAETKWVGGGALAAGLDYQLSRSFTLGFAWRQHFLLTEGSRYPVFTQLSLRAEYVWGW